MIISKISPILFLSAIALFVIGCAPANLLRCKDQQIVETKNIAAELNAAPFVCVGEVHGEYKHHEDQLAIIRNLHEAGVELALGLEMFSFIHQPVLDRWNQGDLDQAGFAQFYAQNWKVPIAMYESIFIYAKEKHIPLLGLNLPPTLANKVAHQGYSSLTSMELQGLPDNVSCKQDSTQMRFLRQMIAAHGGDEASFRNFCEAQTLRDKTIALKVYQYQQHFPRKTLLILAGVGHCLKQGIVEHLDNYSGKRTVVILPAISDQILGHTVTSEEADFLIQ
jgi:uncharacterized iron-regulated protein